MLLGVLLTNIMQDTITGFLLSGVGDINVKREPNFLIVNKGLFMVFTLLHHEQATRAHDATDTTVTHIEEAFKKFVSRDDVAIILINQTVRWFHTILLWCCYSCRFPIDLS